MKDLFGKAILDYQTNNHPENLITETNISESDEMEVSYLFRNFEQMPPLEQKALSLAKGRIIDIGCGAGSHSLYLQNVLAQDVLPVDISVNAISACRLRGLANAQAADFMQIEGSFDTILLLMNGIGLCGRMANIDRFLQKLKSMLRPDGQILLDSSDIIYMFDEDNDGGRWIPSDMEYYGELTFKITYKGEKETPLNWIYVDFNSLKRAAEFNGLNCEMVMEGEHYDYLARLTLPLQ